MRASHRRRRLGYRRATKKPIHAINNKIYNCALHTDGALPPHAPKGPWARGLCQRGFFSQPLPLTIGLCDRIAQLQQRQAQGLCFRHLAPVVHEGFRGGEGGTGVNVGRRRRRALLLMLRLLCLLRLLRLLRLLQAVMKGQREGG